MFSFYLFPQYFYIKHDIQIGSRGWRWRLAMWLPGLGNLAIWLAVEEQESSLCSHYHLLLAPIGALYPMMRHYKSAAVNQHFFSFHVNSLWQNVTTITQDCYLSSLQLKSILRNSCNKQMLEAIQMFSGRTYASSRPCYQYHLIIKITLLTWVVQPVVRTAKTK